jgi:preprotein translocase subunit YajC
MNFFISDAMAAAPQGQGDPLMSFLPLIFIFIVFYFLLIRPQSKKAKEHKQMVEALSKGDEVVTNGGLLGRITKVGDNFVELEVADGISVRVQRHAVANLMPKGTIKSL